MMAKRVSSYQKLKQRLHDMSEYQLKLLEDPEFYVKEALIRKVQIDVARACMMGSAKENASLPPFGDHLNKILY